MKTIAGRGQDIVDIENVAIKQRDLDWSYIDTYLENASEYKDISESIEGLSRIRVRHSRG